MLYWPDRSRLGLAELIAPEGPSRDGQPEILVEPRGRPGGGLLHAAHGSQHLPLEQHGRHLRDAPFQLGQRGVHGGAGLINEYASEAGTSALPGGSLILSPRRAEMGGGTGHHPAARMAGTDFATLEGCGRGTTGRP